MISNPERETWIGPLPGWELVRLARRGHVSRARLMVLYFLMIAFILSPVLWFSQQDPISLFTGQPLTISIADLAGFSSQLSIVILITMLLSVAAIAPGYSAAAIAEEKDRQTLQLLLSSGLSDREIILGKTVGRLVFVLAAAFGALPVLAATTLFGGVSWQFLVSGSILIAATSILAVAIGIHSACVSPDLLSALGRAYFVMLLAVIAAFLSPLCIGCAFQLLVDFESSGGIVLAALVYAVFQSTIACVVIHQGMKRLRDEPPLPNKPLVAPLADPEVKSAPSELDHLIKAKDRRAKSPNYRDYEGYSSRPSVSDDDPILWKERYVGRWGPVDSHIVIDRVTGFIGVLALILGAYYSMRGINWLQLIANTACNWMLFSQLVVGSAASIARERHKNTLDGLRGLPMDSNILLSTKLQAVIERSSIWLGLSIITGYSAFAFVSIPLAISITCFLLSGFILVLGLGTWLSIRCTTELKALRWLMPAAVIFSGFPCWWRIPSIQ